MSARARPRLGFVGLGWIGCARLAALAERGEAEIVALADPAPARLDEACALAPGASRCASVEELLAHELDGVVIATPSALHAEQALRALDTQLAVFCQKPLARDAAETRRVVHAAREADRLLGVDLSYRHLDGVRIARELLQSGELGRPFAARLVFHNAYGPDKPWFRDAALSGGGCVIDLGTHLVDLALELLGGDASDVHARLFARGEPLARGAVEDYAVARLDFASGAVAEIACSWWLAAGRDAVIEIALHGTRGGIAIRNVAGSFYDFETVALQGTAERLLAREGREWGDKAIAEWARRIAAGERFDPAADALVRAAEVVDRIYGRA